MKMIHISDLHLGKKVNGFSMIDDQKHILSEIIKVVDEENPQALLIAGDIYDRPVPPIDAIKMFDDFIYELVSRNITVFAISGNHDSVERLSFASRLINRSKVYFSPEYTGKIEPISMSDEFGKINFYLIPFFKPSHIRAMFPACDINSYNDAMEIVLSNLDINRNERNVVIVHQFITGANTDGSEELSIGGSENISASLFSDFDYVALGHIHREQQMSDSRIRYSGTPLKYSFSETSHKKSVTIIELDDKDNSDTLADFKYHKIELSPIHDMRKLYGSYMELTDRSNYINTKTDDYLHITLTDENDIVDVLSKLRVIYPNIMQLQYDNARTRNNQVISDIKDIEDKSPLDLFSEFYKAQNNSDMSDEQKVFSENIIKAVWEDNK